MNNEGFVNIASVFTDKNERTIEKLKEIYLDHQRMVEKISSLTSEYITEENLKGKKILLKPNWVRHSVKPADELCLRTNDNFILAALEVVLSKSPASVVIGDAPVQGCRWEKMISEKFIERVENLSNKYKIPVTLKDFRRVVFYAKDNRSITNRKPLDEYIIFDVAEKSYLEPITSSEKNLFRVTQYNPDRFTESHKKGMHKYCITKELFKADVVISLPKVKTHQKAGITAALKNLVGVNGDKDFLPHHRLGGTGMGGDCYPGKNYLRYTAEILQDNANRRLGKKSYKFWVRMSAMIWRFSLPRSTDHLAAGWYGNDTTWRMVMDLNTIVNFGKEDGTISDKPQRILYSLCDGIIGGEGDGPLKPDPLNLGVICFSNDSARTDICMASMMGMDVNKIPLLVAAKSFMSDRKISIIYNGSVVSLEDLKKDSVKAVPPPGWVNYLKVSD
ncbi:MAG: DUF362 domain-containing protein [Ignavibacteria bacterium]|nr:DUF362 domain-containing protein [Ignavibacteria bacterium]